MYDNDGQDFKNWLRLTGLAVLAMTLFAIGLVFLFFRHDVWVFTLAMMGCAPCVYFVYDLYMQIPRGD